MKPTKQANGKSMSLPGITMKFSNSTSFLLKNPMNFVKEAIYKQQSYSPVQKLQIRAKQLHLLKTSLFALTRENKQGIARELAALNCRTKQFLNEHHQFKFVQKQLVAKSFCNHGYGPQALLQLIKGYRDILINRPKYEIIAKSVLTEAVKKLQKFILEECKIKVMKLQIQELSPAYKALLNCRVELRRDDCETLLGLIKVVYGLASMTISEVAGLKLYVDIREQILNTNSNVKSLSFTPPLSHSITPEKKFKIPPRTQIIIGKICQKKKTYEDENFDDNQSQQEGQKYVYWGQKQQNDRTEGVQNGEWNAEWQKKNVDQKWRQIMQTGEWQSQNTDLNQNHLSSGQFQKNTENKGSQIQDFQIDLMNYQ